MSVMTAKAPVLIQGPMPIEADFFVQKLSDVHVETTGKFTFYIGALDAYPVIVSKTGKGMENTAAATAIAIERYRPLVIINQGTSGGHDKSLNVGDIVLGRRTVNVGNMKTPVREEGRGTHPLTWIPMDIMASEGSAGEGEGAKDAERIRYHEGSPELLAAAKSVQEHYTRGKVVEGTIGSANFWNNEIDRVSWLHEKYDTSVEEMEGAAAAMMAESFQVPMLGIRVVTNNITNGGKYDPSTARHCQEFVLSVARQFISTIPDSGFADLESDGMDLAAFLGDALASPMSGEVVVCDEGDDEVDNEPVAKKAKIDS